MEEDDVGVLETFIQRRRTILNVRLTRASERMIDWDETGKIFLEKIKRDAEIKCKFMEIE